MTLQASGTISIADIVAEFGGAAPHSLSEYYRGGAYVGSSNTGVPTGGAIGLSDFYGAAAITYDSKTITCGTWTRPSDGGKGSFDQTHNGMGTTTFPGMNFGSIAPTTFRGSTIIACLIAFNLDASKNLYFVIAGSHPQNHFIDLEIKNGGTSLALLTSAGASYFYDSSANTTRWLWSGVGDILPSSGTRTAIFRY